MPSTWIPTRRDVLWGASGAALTALGAYLLWPRPAASPASSQRIPLPQGTPEEVGLDPRRLQRAYDLLEGWTTGSEAVVPAGAILVGRRGRVVAPRLFGRMGPERDAPAIRSDAMFL